MISNCYFLKLKFKYYFRSIPCDIVKSKEQYFIMYLSFPIKRNFPYKNQFRIFATKMKSAGLTLTTLRRLNYLMNVNENEFGNNSDVIEVMFHHIYIILSFLIGGGLISFVVLAFEILSVRPIRCRYI